MFRPISPLFLLLCSLSATAFGQTTLSRSSGINSADTWVTLDLTTQTQNAMMTFADAVYNPATGTSSNAISVAPPAITYHVEAGYDASGSR
jgi:hypothetical protein